MFVVFLVSCFRKKKKKNLKKKIDVQMNFIFASLLNLYIRTASTAEQSECCFPKTCLVFFNPFYVCAFLFLYKEAVGPLSHTDVAETDKIKNPLFFFFFFDVWRHFCLR